MIIVNSWTVWMQLKLKTWCSGSCIIFFHECFLYNVRAFGNFLDRIHPNKAIKICLFSVIKLSKPDNGVVEMTGFMLLWQRKRCEKEGKIIPILKLDNDKPSNSTVHPLIDNCFSSGVTTVNHPPASPSFLCILPPTNSTPSLSLHPSVSSWSSSRPPACSSNLSLLLPTY